MFALLSSSSVCASAAALALRGSHRTVEGRRDGGSERQGRGVGAEGGKEAIRMGNLRMQVRLRDRFVRKGRQLLQARKKLYFSCLIYGSLP